MKANVTLRILLLTLLLAFLPCAIKAEDRGLAGPWEFRIHKFDVKDTFEWKDATGKARHLDKLGKWKYGVIGVHFKRLRALTPSEKTAFANGPNAKVLADGSRLFGTDMFIASTSFQLVHLQSVEQAEKVVLGLCEHMVGERGLKTLTFPESNAVVGYADGDEADATLFFLYDPADRNPILVFHPIPETTETPAARISLKSDKGFSVEYGDLADMRAYLPATLKRAGASASNAPNTSPSTKQTTEPLATWPPLRNRLSGSCEVRINNPNDYSAKIALRKQADGEDFTVSPNSTASVSVPDGHYDIYFQYSTDPDALYQGDSFTLHSNGVEIKLVKVVDGNYGIRRVR